MNTFFNLFGLFPVFAVAVGFIFFGPLSEDKTLRNQEREFVASQIRSVKDSLHNPASFELVQALKVGEVLCVVYRGSSATSVLATNHVAILGDKNVDPSLHCEGKVGKSFTFVGKKI